MMLAKYQKLGSINDRNLFLRVLETERPQIKSPANSQMRKSIIDQVLFLCLNIVQSASQPHGNSSTRAAISFIRSILRSPSHLLETSEYSRGTTLIKHYVLQSIIQFKLGSPVSVSVHWGSCLSVGAESTSPDVLEAQAQGRPGCFLKPQAFSSRKKPELSGLHIGYSNNSKGPKQTGRKKSKCLLLTSLYIFLG